MEWASETLSLPRFSDTSLSNIVPLHEQHKLDPTLKRVSLEDAMPFEEAIYVVDTIRHQFCMSDMDPTISDRILSDIMDSSDLIHELFSVLIEFNRENKTHDERMKTIFDTISKHQKPLPSEKSLSKQSFMPLTERRKSNKIHHCASDTDLTKIESRKKKCVIM